MSEKWKKANKGCKGQSKATQTPVAKAYILFAFLGSLDVVYSLVWIVLSFKTEKAKKAALVAWNTNLQKHTSNVYMSNPALVSSIEPFKVTFWSKEDGSTKDKPFEGQYVPWRPKKIEEFKKKF